MQEIEEGGFGIPCHPVLFSETIKKLKYQESNSHAKHLPSVNKALGYIPTLLKLIVVSKLFAVIIFGF